MDFGKRMGELRFINSFKISGVTCDNVECGAAGGDCDGNAGGDCDGNAGGDCRDARPCVSTTTTTIPSPSTPLFFIKLLAFYHQFDFYHTIQ